MLKVYTSGSTKYIHLVVRRVDRVVGINTEESLQYYQINNPLIETLDLFNI